VFFSGGLEWGNIEHELQSQGKTQDTVCFLYPTIQHAATAVRHMRERAVSLTLFD
jgi:hypothetical protein